MNTAQIWQHTISRYCHLVGDRGACYVNPLEVECWTKDNRIGWPICWDADLGRAIKERQSEYVAIWPNEVTP